MCIFHLGFREGEYVWCLITHFRVGSSRVLLGRFVTCLFTGILEPQRKSLAILVLSRAFCDRHGRKLPGLRNDGGWRADVRCASLWPQFPTETSPASPFPSTPWESYLRFTCWHMKVPHCQGNLLSHTYLWVHDGAGQTSFYYGFFCPAWEASTNFEAIFSFKKQVL